MAMEVFMDAGTLLADVLIHIWNSIVHIVPGIIAALIIVIFGWIIGKLLSWLLRWSLQKLGLDRWVKRQGLSGAIWGKNLSAVFSAVLKVYIILLFFWAAGSLIQVPAISSVIGVLLLYLHILFIAAVVLILASLVAEHFKNKIAAADMAYAPVLGNITKALILYFVVVLIAQVAGFKLDILTDVFRMAVMAFAIAIAIVIGLTFGLALNKDAIAIIARHRKRKK